MLTHGKYIYIYILTIPWFEQSRDKFAIYRINLNAIAILNNWSFPVADNTYVKVIRK